MKNTWINEVHCKLFKVKCREPQKISYRRDKIGICDIDIVVINK